MLLENELYLVLEANEGNGGRLGGEDKPEEGRGGGVLVSREPFLDMEGGVWGREFDDVNELMAI